MSPAAKLSAADVREIRKVRGNLAILAKHYGIGKMQVSRIQRGLRWADSFEQEKLPELVRKLTEDNVAAIRAMRGRPTAEIARQFKVSPGYVSEILRGAKRSPV
jgi:adenylosuccinate synthase